MDGRNIFNGKAIEKDREKSNSVGIVEKLVKRKRESPEEERRGGKVRNGLTKTIKRTDLRKA